MYGPLILASNVIFNNLDKNRLAHWQTYALWAAGLTGGLFAGKYMKEGD